MKVLLVLAHPDIESFNHAIARSVITQLRENGHEIVFHDLYKEGFDPILTTCELSRDAVLPPEIDVHCADLASADGIVVVHPNWWGQPPALLKGWVDRIIRPEVAYRFVEGDQGEGVPVGLLKARTAIIFNTANTPADREAKVFGDPLETLWKNCIFDLCGVKTFYRRTFSVMITSTLEQREKWLREVKATIDHNYPK